jgi:thioredoxin reductase (NADPH)
MIFGMKGDRSVYDVIIIGGGPAGLTAAIYTGRAKLRTLVLEAAILGGNAGQTDQIDNYPGFPFGISGADLMENFWKQAQRFGAELKMEEVIGIEESPGGKRVITDQGEYLARSVIITVGARRRELEVEGEKEYLGRGVSYCATCDGAFFQDFPVAVVGGGDSAVKEALYLADIASRVYLIHRREGFRANQTAVDKMLANERIELRLNKVVKRIEGEGMMQSLILQYFIGSSYQNATVRLFNLSSSLLQFGYNRMQMSGNNVFHHHFTTRNSCSYHIGTSFNPIRDDGITASLKLFYSLNLDNIRTGTPDSSSHGV